MSLTSPGVGYAPDGSKKKFQIHCNGQPFAGADDEASAWKMFKMYTEARPGQGYTFILYNEDVKVSEVQSEKGKGGLKMPTKS